MKILQLKVGYMRTNCYILIKNNDVIIVDPGAEYEKIHEEIKGLNLLAILITHYHFDHVGTLDKFKNIKIYDYKNKNQKYKMNEFEFEVIETKGHTNDSVSFYFENENTMFVGDFVFKNTIGRTDLETSNQKNMELSIQKLKEFQKQTKLYPGHGVITTLSDEILNNPFFQ